MSMQSTAAARRPQQREKRTPRYNAMVKINGGWQKIGAAWEVRSGEDALSVQLTAIPVGAWDGRFSLFVPNLDNGQGGEPADPEPEPASSSQLPRASPRTRRAPALASTKTDDEIPF